MAQLVKSVLGDVPDRIKIVQGVSTKSGFPENYIGLSPLPPHPVNTNWEDEMTKFFDNGRSFVLCLKPPIELLSLMWADKINPSVHTMAIYDSFNIRTLFNEKHKFARAVTPKDIADLFGWFHTVYYFETFFAFGETNTVNKSSAGESLFTDD